MNTRLSDVLYQLRLFFVPYLIIVITCIIIKLTHTREEIFFDVNAYHYAWADFILPYVTHMGDGYMVVPIAVYFLLTNYRKALLFASSFAVSGIVVQIAKHIFHSPRPKAYFVGQLVKIHFVKGQVILMTNSFPSGHTVTAFMAATVLAYVVVNKRWGFIFLILAIAVAYSRMYLSQHFFEDVTGGSILSVMATILWLTWIDGKPFLHTVRWNRGLIRK